ncbi:MAG: hypothetical protein IPI64_06300 [Chloracidobacterium sp.]|nr:hypothetical protein [Chloracidobacterium sp.]
MTNRKNQNSILLLATLGVYLGLVLAGATPQVLANAATAKQFDLRDEIEMVDDLDNKPDQASSIETETPSPQTNDHVSNSVRKFLAKFQTAGSLHTFAATSSPVQFVKIAAAKVSPIATSVDRKIGFRLDQILTLTNFPRGSLDPLLASDAK